MFLNKFTFLWLVFALMGSFVFADESKKDMLIISTKIGDTQQAAKIHSLIRTANKEGLKIDFKFDTEIKENEKLKTINEYKVVMFDSLAGAISVKSLLSKYSQEIEQSHEKAVIIPISIDKKSPYRKNITLEENIKLNEYWYNGGEQNFINFARFVNNKFLHRTTSTIKPPIVVPEDGIYHPKNPNLIFKSLVEYQNFLKITDWQTNQKPVIAIAMHRTSVASSSLEHINWLINDLESKGAITIPFYTKVVGDDFVGKQFLTQKDKTIANVIVSFQIMIIDHESLKVEYEKLNIPILHALYYGEGDELSYMKATNGVSISMMPMTYIIPETLGFTDPLIIASQDKQTKALKPIMPQIVSLANKALNMAKLKKTKNSDKKVALMFYNYPPGVNNMGAAFMNIPQSLSNLFSSLHQSGYKIEKKDEKWFEQIVTKTIKPYHKSGGEEVMIDEKTASLYPLEDYLKFFNSLPQDIKTKMTSKWGNPQNSNMIVTHKGKKYFLIPSVQVGNMLILPQPRRTDKRDKASSAESDAALWHNIHIAVNHAYLATYLFVRDSFKADALIHFGTHGTQEWMPGKERGLSVYDDPYLVLGDMPIFYPYITDNLAEALQAKRRGRATLISHQTPPYAISGTYNELSQIMELIAQYKSTNEGLLKANIQKNIIKIAKSINLHKDIEMSEQAVESDFDKFLNKTEDYILGASAAAQPLGMHTFGTYPKEEHLISTVIQMVGKEFIKAADGEKYATKNYKDFNTSKSYQLVKEYVIDNKDIETLDDKFKPYILQAKEYAQNFKEQKEIINLIRALNGEYIKGGVGGDPIRSPKSLPTGINMYGFDPTKIPTKSAFETGSGQMKEFIENYYKTNGKYPNKLTFNLWSLETMRHHGVLEAEIFYAMGVKPVWNEQGLSDEYIQNMALSILKAYLPEFLANGIASIITLPRVEIVLDWLPNDWVKTPKKMIAHAKSVSKGEIIDVEIIPYSELKRPRVDVVISATGLYRDTFPITMQWLAKAVEKVAALKEENNFVYTNTQNLQKYLKEQNLSDSEAQKLSTVRIFSNKTGHYGSGVNKIEDSEHFTADADEKIAKDYLKERGYYFGSDEKDWNQQIDGLDLYAKNLSGTDAVLFSRTSNLYGMLTSDDPYGYFGSIALAIRHIDKKAPKSYIANLRDPKNAKMQTSAEFLSQELRSRYFHPNWIKEMQAEGYSGSQLILDVTNNLWGWQVVDPSTVRDDQWQELHEIYVKDKYKMNMKEWFEKSNPDNLAQMIERMIEAARLGYWQTDEKTIKELKERYKELQDKFKVTSDNEKFNELVKSDKVSGFGMAQAKALIANALAKPNPNQQNVQGQKLEEQQPIKEDKSKEWLLYMLLFAVILAGVIKQSRNKKEEYYV